MEMSNTESYGISLRAAPRGVLNVLEYALFRRGPLASNVFEANAFIRSRESLDRPDLQIVFQPARRNRGTFPFPLGHGFALSVVHLYPKSRGRVSLASADPRAAPVVDPNLLGDPDDLAPTLRGLELSRRIIAAPAFARYRATEVQPGPAAQGNEALDGVCTPSGGDRSSSGQQLPHGPRCELGGRPTASRAWSIRAAGRGCIDLPAHRRRQHECGGGDGGGEGCGHDAGQARTAEGGVAPAGCSSQDRSCLTHVAST